MERATKIEFDDAKVALLEFEADVQAKAPAGANRSATSGFAARVLDARSRPAPYYHDAEATG